GDQRAESSAGESVRLRQGAQYDEVGEFGEPLRETRAGRELEVSLVHADERAVRKFAADLEHHLLIQQVARRVVRRAQEHDLGAAPGLERGRQVEREIAWQQWHLDYGGALDAGSDLVEAEGGRGDHHTVLPGA